MHILVTNKNTHMVIMRIGMHSHGMRMHAKACIPGLHSTEEHASISSLSPHDAVQDGRTGLHSACVLKAENMVAWLLEHGTDVMARDKVMCCKHSCASVGCCGALQHSMLKSLSLSAKGGDSMLISSARSRAYILLPSTAVLP